MPEQTEGAAFIPTSQTMMGVATEIRGGPGETPQTSTRTASDAAREVTLETVKTGRPRGETGGKWAGAMASIKLRAFIVLAVCATLVALVAVFIVKASAPALVDSYFDLLKWAGGGFFFARALETQLTKGVGK